MLSDLQKAQCRLFLGFPDRFRYRDTRLESMLENLSPEAEDQIASLLGKIATVDDALLEAGTVEAGIKRVDEIWFDGAKVRVTVVRQTGRTYVGRLSIILGVPPNADYFGSQGYPGDTFSRGMSYQGDRTGRFYKLS